MKAMLSALFVFFALSFFFGVAAVVVPFPDTHAASARSTVSAPKVERSSFACAPMFKGKGKHKAVDCFEPCTQVVCNPGCTRCTCETIPDCVP